MKQNMKMCTFAKPVEIIINGKKYDLTLDFGTAIEYQLETGEDVMKAFDKLAEADLELRGQGDFFGTKQSGMPDLHFADIIKDIKIIQQAKNDAAEILEDDNDLSSEKNQVLYNRLKEMYKDSTSYFGIG